MSIVVCIGDSLGSTSRYTRAEIEFIEVRPGEGMIFRLANNPLSMEDVTELSEGIAEALRGSAFKLYRVCCDVGPGIPHADGCEDVTDKKDKGK